MSQHNWKRKSNSPIPAVTGSLPKWLQLGNWTLARHSIFQARQGRKLIEHRQDPKEAESSEGTAPTESNSYLIRKYSCTIEFKRKLTFSPISLCIKKNHLFPWVLDRDLVGFSKKKIA